ncbi:hypothetical protein FKW31_15360 [Acetobacter sp. DmW_136]|nr:hypothetical protein FKW31_15360 [Acetobacter sp. DmW_136]
MSILSDCTKYDILDMFPCLTSLGANCLGEDADMFGNTLTEAIQWGPRRGNLTEGLYIGLDYEKVCFAQKKFS